MSETHFGCSAVDRELWLAIFCSLLCRETHWNIRIGKQGYVLSAHIIKTSIFPSDPIFDAMDFLEEFFSIWIKSNIFLMNF